MTNIRTPNLIFNSYHGGGRAGIRDLIRSDVAVRSVATFDQEQINDRTVIDSAPQIIAKKKSSFQMLVLLYKILRK